MRLRRRGVTEKLDSRYQPALWEQVPAHVLTADKTKKLECVVILYPLSKKYTKHHVTAKKCNFVSRKKLTDDLS